MTRWTCVILAGGKGTRMKSPLPKVLHPVAGIPMISHVIAAAKEVGTHEIRVVVGYGENLVRRVVEPLGGICFLQKEQKGTADAVKAADFQTLEGNVLILNGDHPLIGADDLKKLMEEFEKSDRWLSVVSAKLKNPGSFGRIVRHKGEIQAIVEVKDASAAALAINEVNTGIYLARAEVIREFLPKIDNHNAQGEYYLTDLVAACKENNRDVGVILSSSRLAFGVNDQMQLAKATRFHFGKKAKQLMENGVVLIDPERTYIESTVQIGAGTVVYPGAFVKGNTTIGACCVVEPNVMIIDSEVHDSVQIRMGSHLEKAEVRSQCAVGPYGRLRPGAVMHEEAQIGNFVEMKKAVLGKKSKAAHLTYLGDAEIGERTNIGCGVITCNYAVDKKKYKTIIGSDAFIGSDCQFVAPVEVGSGAVVASGSTITENVPENALAIARGRQVNKENYNQSASAKKEQEEQNTPNG